MSGALLDQDITNPPGEAYTERYKGTASFRPTS